jgi:Holliday junction resolvase
VSLSKRWGAGRLWSTEEEEFLKANYRRLSIAEIAQRLGRTENSVESRMHNLGLKKRRWEDWEVEFLKSNWSKMDARGIAEQLGRSLPSVFDKCERMGFIKNRKWSKEEDRFLRENYLKLTSVEIGKTLRRDPKAVQERARVLGLRKVRKWGRDEVKRLFDEWVESKLPLVQFAERKGMCRETLRYLFKKHFPDVYELQCENVMGRVTKYERGRDFEYRVRDHLRKCGFFVLRSPRSLGPVDLVALKKGVILLVQCKTGKYELRNAEKDGLVILAESIGAIPIFAYREASRETHFRLHLIDLRSGGEVEV